jgi:hypothetical protein
LQRASDNRQIAGSPEANLWPLKGQLVLLASIEGGFSAVEKVTTRSSSTSGSEKSASAQGGTEFGIPNVLSLLKINLDGSLALKKGQESGQQTETERYHTYGSLLFRLRSHLDDEKVIERLTDVNSWDAIHPSEFVEVKGVFHPNPLVDALQIFQRLIGLFNLFADIQLGSKVERKKNQLDQKQTGQFEKFIKGILSDLEKGNIRIFVIDLVQLPMYRAVVSLFSEYLRDPTMAEITHKEYRLLGKVVRKVAKDEEGIDLLRGTGMGGIGKQALDQIVTTFGQADGMNLPKVETAINGPALEIVPIAIFV